MVVSRRSAWLGACLPAGMAALVLAGCGVGTMSVGGGILLLQKEDARLPPPITDQPDLVPTALAVPRTAHAGEGLTVTFAVVNQGELAAAPFSARVVLSADKTIDAGDLALGVVEFPAGLGIGRGVERTVSLTLPAATLFDPGAYRAAVALDPAAGQTESDATNNVLWASGPCELRAERAAGGAADLSLDEFRGPGLALAGQAFLVDFTVGNAAGQDLAGAEIVLWATDEAGAAQELARVSLPTSTETTLTSVQSVTIAAAGRYRLRAALTPGSGHTDGDPATNGIGTGRALAVYAAAEFPTPATDRPLIPGDSITFEGDVTVAAPVAVFGFNASKDIAPNYLLDVHVLGLAGFDPAADLLLPSGTNILSSDDDDGVRGARLRLTFSTGRFWLAVQGASRLAAGAFRVLAHVAASPESGETALGVRALPVEQRVNGLVDVSNADPDDDVREYVFFLPFRHLLRLEVSEPARLRTPVLRDLAGTSVPARELAPGVLEATVAPGSYYVEVRPLTGQGASFDLTWRFP